jgi:hypothetical protein
MIYLLWPVLLVLITFICLEHTKIIDKQEDKI